MPFQVFISHSVAPRELGVVYAVANEAAKDGAEAFISDRDWDPKDEVPVRIMPRLREADYVLAIATSGGFQLEWLNREASAAAVEKKPMLIVADRGLDISSGLAQIQIDRDNPATTVCRVAEHIESFGQDRETRRQLAWLAVGGLLFLLFLGSKK
jgi:hypothetical protein